MTSLGVVHTSEHNASSILTFLSLFLSLMVAAYLLSTLPVLRLQRLHAHTRQLLLLLLLLYPLHEYWQLLLLLP